MDNILIIKLGALGDIAQAEGAIHDIRFDHQNDELTVLTTPGYEQLFSRCPWIDHIILDSRPPWHHLQKVLTLRKTLRYKTYRRIYDLQQVDRTRLYYHMFFRGTDWMGDARGCSCYLRRPKSSCASDHLANHLAMQGVRVNHTLASDISWMIEDVEMLLRRKNVPERFVVLIAGGSSEHPEKRWPFFHELAERIMQKGYMPVTVPGPGEIELCQAIPGLTLIDENNCLDVFQLAGVLSRAQFIIGNDTGPTHMAAHLRRPGLALFGHHTPASTTGIQHTHFRWLETIDLQTLTISAVWLEVDRLCRHSAKGGVRLCKKIRHQRKRVP